MASDIVDVKTFQNFGLDSDSDILAIQGGNSRYRLNVSLSQDGNYSVLSNVKGNNIIEYELPDGDNIVKGFVEDKENKAGIYFIQNSNDDHCILRFNSEDNSITRIIWEEAAILPLDADNWTGYVSAELIGNEDEQSLIWADGRILKSIIVNRAISGGYTSYNEEILSFYKRPLKLGVSSDSITVDFIEGPAADNNFNIQGKIFQFAFRLQYIDKTYSTLSSYSKIVYPKDNIPSGKASGEAFYYCIELEFDIQNEPTVVDSYQLLYRIVDIGGGASGSWYIYDTYEYTTQGSQTIQFFNNKTNGIISDSEAVRPFDYVPDIVNTIGVIDDNRILTDVGREGYDNIDLDVTITTDEETMLTRTGIIDEDVDEVSDGSPFQIFSSITSSQDLYYEITINDGGTLYTYTLYTLGLDNDTIYNSFLDYFTGLGLTDLTLTYPSEATLVFTITSGSTQTYIISYIQLGRTLAYRSLKIGAKYKFGIEYGFNGKRGSVQTNDDLILSVPRWADLSENTCTNYITGEIAISHLPPEGATDYRIVSYGSDTDYFEEYCVALNYLDLTDSSSPYTMYLEEPYTIIKKDDMINRMRSAYGDSSNGLDYGFDIQEGDIIQVIGDFYGASSTGGVNYFCTSFYDFNPYIIISVTSDEIKVASSLIREMGQIGLTSQVLFKLQVIRKKPRFDSIAQEFSRSYPIDGGFHVGNVDTQTESASAKINITEDFADVWKTKQVFINPNNIDDYPDNTYSCYSWMEKPRISLYYDSYPRNQGRINVENPNAVQRQNNNIRWGGKWIDEAGVNFISRFDYDDVRNLDDRNGIIVKIQQIGNVLKVYQERKVTSFYLKTTASTGADGSQTYVFDDNVMSLGRQGIEDFGCTHFASYVKNVRNAYFFDLINGAVLRDSANGLQEISDNLMHSYFKQKSNDIVTYTDTVEVFGGWDEDLSMYIISFVDRDNPTDPINETLGFHEPSNRWVSFYSFLPEYYGKISGNQLLSFKDGSVYEHNVNDTHNNFYGVQYNSEVWLHSTEQALMNKIYNSIHVNSVNQWACPEDDSIVIERPIAMQSRLVEGKFKKQEGVYRADFLRDSLNGGSVATRTNLINGRQLRGKEITVKLTNFDTEQAILESVIINSDISK